MKLDEMDRRLIARLSAELPIGEQPFRALADELGTTEANVLERIRRLEHEGAIRRFGAILDHRRAGITANAMAAWVVADERADEIGAYVASLDEVSHCYLREAAPGWPYTLYAMIHAATEPACRRTAAAVAERFGLTEWTLLATKREFKKSSMRYFDTGGDTT